MSACDSCGAQITWALTTNGKKMPIDSAPCDNGNLVLEYQHGDYETRKATEDDRRLARPLHTSHFATCPHAATWRGNKRSQ